MPITQEKLVHLGELAIKINRTVEFIHLVFDWSKQASDKIAELEEEIESLKEKIDLDCY